jgi:urocanate hydratase
MLGRNSAGRFDRLSVNGASGKAARNWQACEAIVGALTACSTGERHLLLSGETRSASTTSQSVV